MAPSTIADIRSALHDALASVPAHDACALLDYPHHRNLGDHLVWLASTHYLTRERGYRLAYVSDRSKFRARDMEEALPEGPIFFPGGGNLGDLWEENQVFREEIIASYHDRPIVVLPQSMVFNNPSALERARDVFNRHPDLTLFLRDEKSYGLALESFDACRVLLAPDMAFALEQWPTRRAGPALPGACLHLSRDDRESDSGHVLSAGMSPLLKHRDWASLYREWTYPAPPSRVFPEKLRRRLPPFFSTSTRRAIRRRQSAMEIRMEAFSREMIQCGVDQLDQFAFIATDRLHGHILSLLLGKPTTLLPNAYHKNRSFYETWTRELPHSHFGEEALREFLTGASSS